MNNFIKFMVMTIALYASTISGVNAATTKFNYQGKVILNGVPVNGTFGIDFRLYNAPTNGTLLSGISQTNPINNGLLNTELDFGDIPFNGQDIFLEIRIQDPSTMGNIVLTPRISINTAPYAIQADFVADNSITTDSIINGSILGLDLDDLTIFEAKIANFQISNVKIVNQTIGFEKFASNGASDGNIIQYNGTSNQWEAVSQSGITTPWVNAGTGIFYQGNVGIGAGNNFTPIAPLDIRNVLDNTLFRVNIDGTIERKLQTRFLTLGYQAFTPEKSSFKYQIGSSGTIAGLTNVESTNTNIKLYAAILLPHDVIITKFELLAFDDDPSNQVSASLKRTAFATNNVSTTLNTVSTGIVPTPGGTIISSNTLNQSYFSNAVYYAFITIPKPGIPGTDLIFSGVKITYEIDSL